MAESTNKSCALAQRECIPCRGGVAPLQGEELRKLQTELGGGWRVVDGKRLEKEFKFPDFRQALAFANKVGELAERVNHHPDLAIAWGQATVVIWTHKIGGLSEADFVFAAKADGL
ncbi:MAG: 4a-hydroxytetrahydrobiopterin dehydratase [Elusimicrobia bacterium]|nr:4a-hydroxytetrahydrobiopterin dehydratase [Elusimicrobiota bacterium]